ncbi:MAG: MarR family transcriptional regulator [Deltaproteobacteria bacterium]|nr:MarR family transcriptional regulator [Deltaproteobacteria bacterium]
MTAARAKTSPRTRPSSRAAELGPLIAQARRLSFHRAAQRLEAHGHSMYAWQLLNQLRKLGSATQRELAAATAQHPAGVSRQLDELEHAGAVIRRRAKSDRRKIEVGMTALGKALFATMQPEVEAALEEVFAALTASEQSELRMLLEKVLAASR